MNTQLWKKVKIIELKADTPNSIAMGPFGSNIKSDNFVPNGVPVIRGGNLNADRFLDDDFVFLTEEKADELRPSNVFPCDLVFTHRGTLGQVGIIPKNSKYKRYVVSQSQMKLSCNNGIIDPFFLFYFFKSPVGQHALLANTSTTGVPAISRPLTSLKDIAVPFPPLPVQRSIASTLGSLDDKIELNRRMNETLEATARALYKSWFVDFDPVKAKAEGKKPFGMDEETAALFPEGFEESKMGRIPKGWKVERLDEIALLSKESINPMEFPTKELLHYSIPAYDEGKIPKNEVGNEIKSNKFIVPKESILLSKLNPRIPRIWLPFPDSDNCAICSTEFLVVLAKNGFDREFLYSMFCSDEFFASFENMVTGTSGSHQRVKPDYLLQMQIIIPDNDAQIAFSKIARGIFKKVYSNMQESLNLSSIRDSLLPRLLSGELSIQDMEKVFS